MKSVLRISVFLLLFTACKGNDKPKDDLPVVEDKPVYDLTIAFGSCNRQNLSNDLWDDVLASNATHWIWGGDVIYADTDDMTEMAGYYSDQYEQEGYLKIINEMEIDGTWDDHDYGLNDGGASYLKKDESQQLFLDFLGVADEDARRKQKGLYYTKDIVLDKGSVKLIILDTRYFRSELTESANPDLRYDPNPYGEGTMLGESQWLWLEKELNTSTADFNVIVSSIQFLSHEHGFETWGNMPHEVDKLKTLIKASQAKGVIILSGDRHISEFSKTTIDGVTYPLIDFTSSGMTHSYSTFSGEPNAFRVGEVIFDKSFGVLKFNFDTRQVTMEMRGNGNVLQQDLIQTY